MLPIRAIPLPVTIYGLAVSGTTAVLGLVMVADGGNFLGRFPTGLVDANGKRAVLSSALYRLLGVGLLLLGVALLLIVVAGSGAVVLVGILLGAIGVIVLLVAGAAAWDERRARSLRRTRSSRAWTVIAFGFMMALNWGLWMLVYGAHGQ